MSQFQVGTHHVATSVRRSRWSVSVDRRPVPGWFESEAAAWSAGVREADHIDRGAAAIPGASPGTAVVEPF